MKKFAVQTILLLLLITGVLIFFNPTGSSGKLDLPFLPQQTTTSSLQINGAILKVEIADIDSKRNKGLSGRDSIATDSGMLFVYAKPGKNVFWMKGMKFPLDFVWIKDDKVVDVLSNVPHPTPNQKDESLPFYTSKEEFNKVLEINAGTIGRLNIKVGDTIKLL